MLVKEGVTTVNEMRRQLKIAVKYELFADADLPSTTNRRYFPNTRIIRSHMVHAKRKQRHSMIDQECLVEKIKIWKEEQPNSKIFFRPTATEPNDDMHENPNDDMRVDDDDAEIKLLSKNGGHYLFIYQSAEQRRLLSRYGNEISFLDATYRTTRYTLPLFFLVVKTNVDYQVVATFVLENEDTNSIQEALEIIKSWNPDYFPKYFMTDYCNEEIHAIENVYEGLPLNLECFRLKFPLKLKHFKLIRFLVSNVGPRIVFKHSTISVYGNHRILYSKKGLHT